MLSRASPTLVQRLKNLVATSSFMSHCLWAAGTNRRGAPTGWMLITVPFVLVGIFRWQLLSDPEEAERASSSSPEIDTQKPEEILLGNPGVKRTLVAWLITHRMGLLLD